MESREQSEALSLIAVAGAGHQPDKPAAPPRIGMFLVRTTVPTPKLSRCRQNAGTPAQRRLPEELAAQQRP